MSETVKLIIEIPEERYKRIAKAPRCVDFSEAVEDRIVLVNALQNGILLDEVKEEIAEHRRKTETIDKYDLLGDALDIIDKYIRRINETDN